jgi:tetratricopeptide (TPR) repeat protein
VKPITCPACRATLRDIADTCAACGVNLKPLARMAALPNTWFDRALAAAAENDLFGAVEALGAALAFNPVDTEAMVLLGKVYIRLEQFEKAVAWFSKALKTDARSREAKNALFWLHGQGVTVPIEELL